MQKILFSALVLTGISAAAAASAVPVTGMLDAVSPGADVVTLADGQSFTFPDSPRIKKRLAEFKPGEMVTIDTVKNDKPWNADAIDLVVPDPGLYSRL
jgi:hypothetical protein